MVKHAKMSTPEARKKVAIAFAQLSKVQLVHEVAQVETVFQAVEVKTVSMVNQVLMVSTDGQV